MSNRAKHIVLSLICIVCLGAAGVLWYFTQPCEQCGRKICFGHAAVQQSGTESSTDAKTEPRETTLAYTGETDENYLDDVYFIGDSRTVGLVRAEMPEDHLFAETGMCHEDALTKRVVILDDTAYLTIPDALQIVAPKIAVVNFGINGIGFMDEDAFIDEYRTMMQAFQKMSPETVFIIESILPVSSSYESTSGVTNEKIDEMNLRLCALAEELGCYYLASDTVMKDENNDLLRIYNDGDGLHYNEKGYEAILTCVKTHVVPEWEDWKK